MSQSKLVKTDFPNALGANLSLYRYPKVANEKQQAWSSADELLVEHLSTIDLTEKKILIINDSFGALSVTLQDYKPTSYSDSYVAHQAMKQNGLNGCDLVNDLSLLSGKFDFVLIKIPKSMSYFEDILKTVSTLVSKESQIICSSMVKHLSKSSFDLLDQIIGETTTSLAKKKARLIFATFSKYPSQSTYPKQVSIEGYEYTFTSHSNLFSRDKLDIGSRFFLEHIPKDLNKTILDLGCANGIIGIRAKQLCPDSNIIFCDDSYMAIKSAKDNYQKFFEDSAIFIWTNCLEDKAHDQKIDLVMCNPPFHQEHLIADHIARQMFNDSYRALKIGGAIRVIGNRHLGYHARLQKLYSNHKVIGQNKKFVIIESIKE